MSTTNKPLDQTLKPLVLDSLQPLRRLPDWLSAVTQPAQVGAALKQHVPELATGDLTLDSSSVERLRLKDGKKGWSGLYRLSVGGPQAGQHRHIELNGTLFSPHSAPALAASTPGELGSADWRCYLPELRLLLEALPEDTALPALPILSAPQPTRELLERLIRVGNPAYNRIAIADCTVKAMRYKRGSRCTVVYQLRYALEDAEQGWPTVVVAKAYSGNKGQNAYDGMRALWEAPLARSALVTLAEPLGYDPELRVLVQGPIQEDQTLEELLQGALADGTPARLEDLRAAMAKTAVALAALHRSQIRYGKTISWDDELAEVRDLLGRLSAVIPALSSVGVSLFEQLEELAAATPPDPSGPVHRAFRPAQVLLHQGQPGFIDFDGFAQSEAALDLALFLRKTRALGLGVLAEGSGQTDSAAQLAIVDAICAEFLETYEAHAPVSRQRVALWEALDLLTLVLFCWTKIEPQRLEGNLLLLEHHLRGMNL